MPDRRGTTLLVVDDEPEMRSLLVDIFGLEGWRVVSVDDGAEAAESYRREQPSVVLLDLAMPRMGGMEALAEIRAVDPDASVIILTAYVEIPRAVEAMRRGAYDYLTKPFVKDELVLTVQRALERRRLVARVEELERETGPVGSLRRLMGPSAEVTRLIAQCLAAARSSDHLTIEGEPGTGKELVARVIHDESVRRGRPFVTLDCGATPESQAESELFGWERGAARGAEGSREGLLFRAAGGTLFVDEVTALPGPAQTRLLRALREGHAEPLGSARSYPLTARLIAAARAPLESEVRAGRLRQDLAAALGETRVTVPPLRERREDISLLVDHYLEFLEDDDGHR